jgi:hypothetical protein
MHLGADMVGDETHDALAVISRQSLPGVSQALGQPIDPQGPSGLSMTSTMAGSSSQAVIAGPIAVRSMRTLREVASDLREIVPTVAPVAHDRSTRSMSGTIKKTQDQASATTRRGA